MSTRINMHTNDDNNDDDTSNTLTVPAADVLRLIQAHLTEVGLHETCRTLAAESGVGLAGSSHSNWLSWAMNGNWAAILKALSVLDVGRTHLPRDLSAAVHEMAILELAQVGDLQLAYATYHIVQSELEQAMTAEHNVMGEPLSRSRILEQRLAALASARTKDPKAPVPDDFYNDSSMSMSASAAGKQTQHQHQLQTKQDRRQEIGRRLQHAIPRQPNGRLPALLQQAIKWQTHTGELPRIKQWWDDNEIDILDNDDDVKGEKKKGKKRRKTFDLVLGEVQVDQRTVNDNIYAADIPIESIPADPYATIRFGKKATAESAVFLPDATGLVTGSSDGLIEIWDAAQKYQQLRLDLPYQQAEELLGHDTAITALAISNDGLLLASGSTDGMVKVWRVDTGKCLRQIPAHQDSVVSCVAFSPDASHILTGSHDGTSREFGLRTARMLKEFRGHGSYVNFCAYQLLAGSSQLLVVTGSADGTVRLWDGKTSDVVRVLRPISLGSSLTGAGTSIVVDHQADASAEGGSPTIHSVLRLHTPPNTMIVVPRGLRAFLVNYSGVVLRVFEDSTATEKVFVAATVSSSNQWLYAVKEDGACCVFDVSTGDLKQTITDFGAESTSRSKDDATAAEISSLLHHPTKSILAAFSNDKGQKRGQIVLWK
jgi:WD40 repeat-containing protein SMU1